MPGRPQPSVAAPDPGIAGAGDAFAGWTAAEAATLVAIAETFVPGDAERRARLAAEAGAAEMVALGTPARWYRRAGAAPAGVDPAFDAYLTSLASWDPAPGRGMVFSAHQMGTARAGADAASHPCDPDGRVRAGGTTAAGVVKGLYVADASLFPTASGVNPMITTMLLARRVARTVLAESGAGG